MQDKIWLSSMLLNAFYIPFRKFEENSL